MVKRICKKQNFIAIRPCFFNKKGVTFIETVIAATLLLIFIAGYYKAFLHTKKVDRRLESVSNSNSLSSSILEQFYYYQGTGYRGGNRITTFDSANGSSEVFEDGSHDLDTLDSLLSGSGHYNLETSDYVVKSSAVSDVIADVTYTVVDYTANQNGNIYSATSGPGQYDGFRRIHLQTKWEDAGLEAF